MGNRINYALLLAFCCGVFFSACFPKKNLLKDKEDPPIKDELLVEKPYQKSDKDIDALIKELSRQYPNYNWVVAKGKAQYEGNGQDISFTLQLRQQKDTLTWLSVKKVSVEGARIKLTPDSLQFINYQENEYTHAPFSFLQTQYNIPLSFAQWQALLLGAPLLHEDINWDKSVEKQENKYYISGKYQQALLNITLQQGDYFMHEQALSIGNFSVRIAYGKYTYLSDIGLHIPLQIEITFQERGQKPTVLFINYNEVNFQAPSNVRFEIPAHYKFVEMPRF